MTQRRGFLVLVFVTAFSCLTFELIMSRVADFHLDFRNSFLAIPIAFLGLALGSLHVHFRPRIAEGVRIHRTLFWSAVVSALTLVLVFLVFGRYLPVIGSPASDAIWKAALVKIPCFILAFALPFYFFGRILTVSYYLNRSSIAGIYSADFFGASTACFLTPIVFHCCELPGVILVFTLAVFAVALMFTPAPRGLKIGLALLLIGASVGLYGIVSHLDKTNNFSIFLPSNDAETGEEVAHGWNEFSRVSLAKFTNRTSGAARYGILHDNAVSNVHVAPFHPGTSRSPERVGPYEVPLLLAPEAKKILVMFAGCGAEMVRFDEFTAGAADITGVEINPLVKKLASETPDLASYNLRAFYDLPNIHLEIREGRGFLLSDPEKYDIIFIGSKAATTMRLSGHTRKYLDTEEAYELYLRHLKPGGVILFDHQPIGQTLTSLHWVFRKMGLPPLSKCAVLFSSPWGGRDLAICPDGVDETRMLKLAELDKKSKKIIYAPWVRESSRDGHAALIVATEPPRGLRTTDDRPYESTMTFSDYRLFPTADQRKNGMYYMNWSKVTTLLFVGGLALALILLTYLRREGRMPLAGLGYLLLTGFCYLIVEVVYMAKLELFLQDPLVSMATVLSAFLLSSGLGSYLFRRCGDRVPMRIFPFAVSAIVLTTAGALAFLNGHWLYLPLVLRLPISMAVMAPTGVCLGVFYPYLVAKLVANGHEKAVPVSYGMSTLASVLGATYAMTMIINWGGNHLLQQAAAGYALLGVFMILYGLLARRGALTA